MKFCEYKNEHTGKKHVTACIRAHLLHETNAAEVRMVTSWWRWSVMMQEWGVSHVVWFLEDLGFPEVAMMAERSDVDGLTLVSTYSLSMILPVSCSSDMIMHVKKDST
jgi:hypothetical protein